MRYYIWYLQIKTLPFNKVGCTRKRKQVFFSLVCTSFAAHLQHAHANGLFYQDACFLVVDFAKSTLNFILLIGQKRGNEVVYLGYLVVKMEYFEGIFIFFA